jgi:hypothetical protein
VRVASGPPRRRAIAPPTAPAPRRHRAGGGEARGVGAVGAATIAGAAAWIGAKRGRAAWRRAARRGRAMGGALADGIRARRRHPRSPTASALADGIRAAESRERKGGGGCAPASTRRATARDRGGIARASRAGRVAPASRAAVATLGVIPSTDDSGTIVAYIARRLARETRESPRGVLRYEQNVRF